MMRPPERSAARDAAIAAMLPNVPFDGWTETALRRGLAAIGVAEDEAGLLFPGGTADMLEAFIDWADRRMEEAAARLEIADKHLPERVSAVIALRLAQNRPYKEAIRRAVALLALPSNVGLAASCTARTIDAIWHAAGDNASDFSWYTKRAILTAVYSATLLYWLRDTDDEEATLAFLDRRLAGVGRIGAIRRRAEALFGRLRPA